MTQNAWTNLTVILLLAAVVFGIAAVFAVAARRWRPAGTPADVAAFAAALDRLEDVSIAYNTAMDAEAARRGLTGEARRRFYAETPESDEWYAANIAVIIASDHISAWQEFLVRNGFLKIKNQETGR